MMHSKEKRKWSRGLGRWCLMALMILLGLHILIACAGPEGGSTPDENSPDTDDGNNNDNPSGFTITDVGYAIMNVDSAYMPVSDFDAEIDDGYWFQIDYNGQVRDIEDMTITFSLGTQCKWTVTNLTEDNLTGTNGLVVRGLKPSNNTIDYQWSDDILPLGDLRVDVNLGAGLAPGFTKTISMSGEDSTTTAQYVYSEDAQTSQNLPPNSVNMIPKALTSNGVYDSATDTITCNFTVEDNRIVNGEIWLYNEDGEAVAVSDLFVMDGTRNMILNDGNPLDTIGGENTITIASDAEEINYLEGYGFENISQFAVVLTDGAKLSDGLSIFESGCLSYTSKYPIHAIIE